MVKTIETHDPRLQNSKKLNTTGVLQDANTTSLKCTIETVVQVSSWTPA